MKKLTLMAAALLCAAVTFSQTPVNDDCAGLIDLGVAPACPLDTFNNVNATASNIGFDNNPSCFNGSIATHDVWFMFTCPDTLFDFRITLTGVGANSIEQPEFAVYRGDCTFDGLAELLCAKADIGENELFLDVTGLTPGLQYFIRVSDYSVNASPNWGDFVLCVDKIPPITEIDDGGSSLCSGTLYDTGGPDGDYGPGEDFVFTICPNQPSECITFTLDYYNIETPGGFGIGSDLLTFYDGDGTTGTVLASFNGAGFSQTDIAAGGGVCFSVSATSGCMTIQFQSDAFTELEGWKGHWECSDQPCAPAPVMTVSSTVTNQDIIDAVSTPATVVSVANVTCPNGGYGVFSFPTDMNETGLEKGLILTSGQATIALGPNNLTGAGIDNGVFGVPDGDAELDYLSQLQGNGAESNDACVVELDVFVATNELTFEYVFGSDEYPEYSNSSFNDIFAFLVSGPGIVGDPNINNQVNIALIPGTNAPVQINSVNNINNWPYYRNNELSQSLQYDGLTSDSLAVKKTLTARADVIPCNTYRLKLAVADRFDGVFDSGVFISKIQGGTPDLKVQFASGIDYFVEDCSGNSDQLVVSLSQAFAQDASFTVTIGGTAELGVDYNLNIPAVITFPAGQTQLSFPIFPLTDALVEGTETITVSLSNNFGCGEVVYKTLTIELKDNIEVSVNAGADTVYFCAGSTTPLQLEAEGASDYFWQPPGAVSNPFIANPTILPTADIELVVTGTLASCVDLDTVYVKIVAPSIEILTPDPVNICQGTTVPLIVINNVSNQGLTWTPTAGLDIPNSSTPNATPTQTTTYTASVTVAGCTVSDQITFNVDTLFFPTLTIGDTTVCQNYPVKLANDLNNTTTDYLWSPATGLDDPASSGPLALPDETTTYTLVATSANGYCNQTASVTIDVIAANVDILGDGYREICLGDTLQLTANIAPTGALLNWSPAFYVNNPTATNVVTSPDETVTLFATYNANNCVVRDSIQIRVDSLPQSDIALDPNKPIYCPGDTIYMISKTYEPASFPDIVHEWQTFGGMLTPEENWNMVINATVTHTFYRQTSNRACARTDSILVPVGIPPTVTITATPQEICPGEPVQLNATVDPPDEELEWEDNGTLSCTDCPSPTANPFATTTYTVSTPGADCPSGNSITITVVNPPALSLPANQAICQGSSILLNNTNQPNVTYTWTSNPPGAPVVGATPTVSPNQTTTYTVVADGPQCSSTGTVTIEVVTPPNVSVATDQTVCAGTPVQLNTIEESGVIYNWASVPAGAPVIGATPTVTPTQTTTYVLTAVKSACTVNAAVTITVIDLPELQLSPDRDICLGDSVLLNNSFEPGVTYTWTTDPAGTPVTGATPMLAPAQTTTYSLTAAAGQCSNTGEVTITVITGSIDAGATQTICSGSDVVLTANMTTNASNVTFLWDPSNKITGTITEQPADTTLYTVLVTYGPGCQVFDNVLVNVLPSVQVSDITIVPDTSAICEGTPVTLKVTVNPPTATLVWTQDGTPITATGDSIVVTPQPQPGDSTLIYVVTATDASGCVGMSDPVTVNTVRCFAIPNAFTPNGDDNNDAFGLALTGGDIEVKEFVIFNRWGQKVFTSKAGTEKWDGKIDGKEAPSDVYVYYMTLRFASGEEKLYKGDVTLLR